MTIRQLKEDLEQALLALEHGEPVAAERVEQWAAALERTERDHPDPASRLFSAAQLRARAAKGEMASLKTEITIVLAKLAHWNAAGLDQGSEG